MIDELHYDAATKVLLEFKTRFWEQGPGGFTGGGCVSDSASRFTYIKSAAQRRRCRSGNAASLG
jgi:monoamine oxidase